MHAGFCLLRLSPRDFWQLTPREFFCMAGGFSVRPQGLERAGLTAMMTAFPDRPVEAGGDISGR